MPIHVAVLHAFAFESIAMAFLARSRILRAIHQHLILITTHIGNPRRYTWVVWYASLILLLLCRLLILSQVATFIAHRTDLIGPCIAVTGQFVLSVVGALVLRCTYIRGYGQRHIPMADGIGRQDTLVRQNTYLSSEVSLPLLPQLADLESNFPFS
jgi:hypothetical protein